MLGLGPRFRFTLDGMKFEIMNAIHEHHEEVEAEIEKELIEVIKNFDFHQAVRTAANQALKQAVLNAVTEYFRHGEGQTIVQEIIFQHLHMLGKNNE